VLAQKDQVIGRPAHAARRQRPTNAFGSCSVRTVVGGAQPTSDSSQPRAFPARNPETFSSSSVKRQVRQIQRDRRKITQRPTCAHAASGSPIERQQLKTWTISKRCAGGHREGHASRPASAPRQMLITRTRTVGPPSAVASTPCVTRAIDSALGPRGTHNSSSGFAGPRAVLTARFINELGEQPRWR
jgi:hypothetical protein